MRLDKLLSISAGLSRSQARTAIRAGRVLLNGQAVVSVDLDTQADCTLTLDGRELSTQSEWHVMLNKPTGLLTAARDSRAPTIMDILPERLLSANCMPVGRLDKDTEGLLLLTTDGELAHRLLSPKRGVVKAYQAEVLGRLTQEDVLAFAQGVALSDFQAMPAELIIMEADDAKSVALVELAEGKHRQVRRMFARQGYEATALKRLRFGPLVLDECLAPGQYRELRAEELQSLREAVRLA